MLPRTLEPEVMDSVEEASDYDRMDHSGVNRAFVDEFLAAWNQGRDNLADAHLIDVGTGTAQIPVELSRRDTGCRVVAVDLAGEMLKLARRNIAEAQAGQFVEVELVDAKSLPHADGQFDGVISNSIIHHIAEPGVVFREILRVLKPGGLLFVRDLMRPDDGATVDRLVETYAGDESRHAQKLFHQSLHAALTLSETQQMVVACGGDARWVHASSDRHWTICGRRPNR
ncbi:MAG: class I SAM-dependent methyltransferase [Planctomycetota bacterium]|nr:class I SAM-dependent methyltransferase [Planctomycetota bacterium]